MFFWGVGPLFHPEKGVFGLLSFSCVDWHHFQLSTTPKKYPTKKGPLKKVYPRQELGVGTYFENLSPRENMAKKIVEIYENEYDTKIIVKFLEYQ